VADVGLKFEKNEIEKSFVVVLFIIVYVGKGCLAEGNNI
jgi:hypothetical protein